MQKIKQIIKNVRKYFFERRQKNLDYCQDIAGEDIGFYASLSKGKSKDKLEYLSSILIFEYVQKMAENKKEADVFRLGVNSFLEFCNECASELEEEKKNEEKVFKKKIIPRF